MSVDKVCDLSDGYALHSQDGVPAIMTRCGNTFVCSALEASRLALDAATRDEWNRQVRDWLHAHARLRTAGDPRWRAAIQAEQLWRVLWASSAATTSSPGTGDPQR